MATVTVEVNGRPYAVGCADGQEERVRELARQFDAHVRQVAGEVGHVGDIRLFLMAGLLLADELDAARSAGQSGNLHRSIEAGFSLKRLAEKSRRQLPRIESNVVMAEDRALAGYAEFFLQGRRRQIGGANARATPGVGLLP